MEELAKKAAEAMAELGDYDLVSWRDRKQALLDAGKRCGSGFEEVLAWFESEAG